MPTVSTDEARTQIADIIGASVFEALGLKEALQDERRALEAQDVDGLNAVVDAKSSCVDKLRQLDERRNGGIASQLVDLCLDALAGQGIVKSHVHVLENNRLGRDYWSRRGWMHRAEIVLYSFINGDNKNA